MSGEAVLAWLKSNWVIVICCVVIVGSLIAGPVVSSSMNEEVAKETASRVSKIKKLNQAGKTSFVWPGDASQRQEKVINQVLIDEYEKVAEERIRQSTGVIDRAMQDNRGDVQVLMPELFPIPTDRDRDLEVLPPALHEKIMSGYESILALLHAGQALSREKLLEKIVEERKEFIDRNFMKGDSDALTPDEEKTLEEFLVGERLRACREHANDIGIYLSLETLGPPPFKSTDKPTMEQMWGWQWRLWVVERVAAVIAEINGQSPEPAAAIHEISQFDIRGLMSVNTPPAGNRTFASAGSGGGGSGGFGGPLGPGPGSSGSGQNNAAPGAGTRDYTKSVTGRVTNTRFDVVLVDLDMVVMTNRIDDILETLTQPTVMSVLDVELARMDPFEALKSNHYYGEQSVSRLVVTLETIWLRDWLQELMPDEARTQIGIAARPSSEGTDDEDFDDGFDDEY